MQSKSRYLKFTDICDSFGGTIVIGECYEFMKEELGFEDARNVCIKKGGDLWVPPLDKPSILKEVGMRIPEMMCKTYFLIFLFSDLTILFYFIFHF